MSYLSIPDFKFGMDRRRKRVSGVAGTLWILKNAHITRGGDIERAKKFVSKYALPAGTPGTIGLAKVRRQLYTFGSEDMAALMPTGVLYQRLQAPFGPPMSRVLDWKVFANKLYVVAEYANGNVFHFYNGSRVTAWDALADGNSDFTTLASYLESKINGSSTVTALASGSTLLITARVPGVPFSISQAIGNRGVDTTQSITLSTVQANVPAVAETRGTASVTLTGGSSDPGISKVTGVTVNGVALMQVPVNWVLSNAATASAVATEINNRSSTHGYTALAAGAIVTLTAPPGSGATRNGHVVAISTAGSVTASTSGTVTGGVTAVAAVAQISKAVLGGVYEPADEFYLTIDGATYAATGRASGTGLNVFVNKNRVWSVAGVLLNGCKLNDPTNWSDATASTGSVSIDVSSASGGNERLVGMAEYQTLVAVYSRTDILLYQFSADATLISLVQSLSNTGAMSNRSILGYGNNDVYYLDPTGYRSIQVRANSNAPYVSDIGSAIDVFVREHINTLTADAVSRAVATIEPTDGRLWLALGERIYVLSFFPSSKINAWSYYEPPVPITDFVRVGDALYARGGDTIYLYGGDTGTVYPNASEQIVSVKLPFLTADKPANEKDLNGYDVALDNEWLIECLIDPNDETKKETIGRLNRHTFHLPDVGVAFRTTTFALELTCSGAGPATLSALTMHFSAESPAK